MGGYFPSGDDAKSTGIPDYRLDRSSLLSEYDRLKSLVSEHLDWIEDHPELPPKHKSHVTHLPRDGYVLFRGLFANPDVLLADPERPETSRSTTVTFWTIGLGRIVSRLLKSLKNDFVMLNRFRNSENDNDHYLYSLPENVRGNWNSLSEEAQNFEVASIGARRVRDLRNRIIEHLDLGQDFSVVKLRLENEISDFDRALSKLPAGATAVMPNARHRDDQLRNPFMLVSKSFGFRDVESIDLADDEIRSLLKFWHGFPKYYVFQEHFHSEFAFDDDLKLIIKRDGKEIVVPLEFDYQPAARHQKEPAEWQVSGPFSSAKLFVGKFWATVYRKDFEFESPCGRYTFEFKDSNRKTIKVICDLYNFVNVAKSQISTESVSIVEMHKDAETLIAGEMESRGIDCQSFRKSGHICRKIVTEDFRTACGRFPLNYQFDIINVGRREFKKWYDCLRSIEDASALPQWDSWWPEIEEGEVATSTLLAKIQPIKKRKGKKAAVAVPAIPPELMSIRKRYDATLAVETFINYVEDDGAILRVPGQFVGSALRIMNGKIVVALNRKDEWYDDWLKSMKQRDTITLHCHEESLDNGVVDFNFEPFIVKLSEHVDRDGNFGILTFNVVDREKVSTSRESPEKNEAKEKTVDVAKLKRMILVCTDKQNLSWRKLELKHEVSERTIRRWAEKISYDFDSGEFVSPSAEVSALLDKLEKTKKNGSMKSS